MAVLWTGHQIYQRVLNKAYDVDGYYGAQCWDGYAYILRDLFKVPYANCTTTGYAQDIWNNRASNGMRQYFHEVSVNNLKDGDIAIFRQSAVLPGSHIGVFRKFENGAMIILGQNQRGNGNGYPFTQDYYPVSECLGGLRLKVSQNITSNVKPKPTVKPVEKPFVISAHVQNKEWLPGVTNNQVAGTTGKGLRLEAFRIDTKGKKLNVQVHVQDVGWMMYKNVQPNTTLGTTGKSKRLEAIILEPIGWKLMGRVHIANEGWSQWRKMDGKISLGSVGEKKQIEAIQLKVY